MTQVKSPRDWLSGSLGFKVLLKVLPLWKELQRDEKWHLAAEQSEFCSVTVALQYAGRQEMKRMPGEAFLDVEISTSVGSSSVWEVDCSSRACRETLERRKWHQSFGVDTVAVLPASVTLPLVSGCRWWQEPGCQSHNYWKKNPLWTPPQRPLEQTFLAVFVGHRQTVMLNTYSRF